VHIKEDVEKAAVGCDDVIFIIIIINSSSSSIPPWRFMDQ
jgi:hypothetical protein